MDLLFYDIEVFKYNSLIVFKDINNKEVAHFWNDGAEGFSSASQDRIKEVLKGKRLVGYNNHYYDDKILTTMLRPKNGKGESNQDAIKQTNDQIINGGKVYFDFDIDAIRLSYDCMQQIDVSVPSLKRIEGNLGKSVIESEIPFDIGRELSEPEKKIVLDYCRYDVENTIEVYKMREASYFLVRKELLEMLPDNLREANFRRNTTSISADILLKQKLKMWTSIKKTEMMKDVPSEVFDSWIDAASLFTIAKGEKETVTLKKEKPITIEEFGCSITFGSGGLHGVKNGQKVFKNVKLLDVGSMYPSIITYLEALGPEGTKKYDEIRKERLRIKHTDKTKAAALKLILNSVYGNLNNQYSKLNNPKAALTVCAYGQSALYELCRKLNEAGYEVMNINTDGVGFTSPGIDDSVWQGIQKEWEEKWHLSLELDEFDLWIQKDVNNYIALQGDHVKVKGGDLNKYQSPKYFSNNNARIVHMATAESLLDSSLSPEIFIQKHKDQPELFQYILQAGSTYLGTCTADGKILPQKVNRVFPVKEGTPGAVKLYKKRPDGGKVLFPDMPDNVKLWNDDVSKYTDFAKEVDFDFYNNLVHKKLEGWR